MFTKFYFFLNLVNCYVSAILFIYFGIDNLNEPFICVHNLTIFADK